MNRPELFDKLRSITKLCCKCRELEKPPVPPAGNVLSNVLFVARNPGEDEHSGGYPLIGRGGKLFNKALVHINWPRSKVLIHNTCLCFSAGNRQPIIEEIMNCRRFLKAVLKLSTAKVIVTLGRDATENTLHVMTGGKDSEFVKIPGAFKDIRKKVFKVPGDHIIVPIIHPGEALRGKVPQMYSDMERIKELFPDLEP